VQGTGFDAHRAVRESRWLQVLVVFVFWGVGEALVRVTHVPFPGSIAGLLALLALLVAGILDVRYVERGAGLFLGQMLLFFVPAVVAVVDHPEWAGALGLRLLAAILVGTVVVMLVTGAVVEACWRLIRHGEGRDDAAR
jgi:holin-like protein